MRHCAWPYSPSDDLPSAFRFESLPQAYFGEVQELHPSIYMGLYVALTSLQRVLKALKYCVFLQSDGRFSSLCCRFFRQLASRTVPLRLSSDIRRFTSMASLRTNAPMC